jgi:BirA family biotin operon repressor/biotin-[acetyl-CoA-carboxylase] ligase
VLGPVETVEEIDSTNAELLRRAAAGAPAGSVLVARHQSAGRGRRDRRWEAPPGASLLVSVLLRPALDIDDLFLANAVAGLAAVAACRVVVGVELALKWPNDVIEPETGAKVAGLLAESVLAGCAVEALVVGMGLNVCWEQPVPDGGVALNQLTHASVAREAVLERWLARFDDELAGLATAEGRANALARYRDNCATIGRRVKISLGDEDVEGTASAIDQQGRLVVDGRAFAVGDVVHVRPANP